MLLCAAAERTHIASNLLDIDRERWQHVEHVADALYFRNAAPTRILHAHIVEDISNGSTLANIHTHTLSNDKLGRFVGYFVV